MTKSSTLCVLSSLLLLSACTDPVELESRVMPDAESSNEPVDDPGTNSDEDAATPDAGEVDAAQHTDAAAMPPDAGPDASTNDASPPAEPLPPGAFARLRLTRGGVRLSGARVVAHDADGVVLDELTSDANGHVVTSRAAAQLTVVMPESTSKTDRGFFTYFGIERGDDLQLDVAGVGETRTRYVVGINQPVAGAESLVVTGGPDACLWGTPMYAGDTLATVKSEGGCIGVGDYAILLAATHWESGTFRTLGYALVDGLPARGAVQAVSVGAFTPPRLVEQRFSNTPAVTYLSSSRFVVLRDQWLSLNDEHDYRGANLSALPAPDFAFDAWATSAVFQEQTGGMHSLLVRGDGADHPPELDFRGLLPDITGSEITNTSAGTQLAWISRPSEQRTGFAFEVSLSVVFAEGGERQDYAKWAGLVAPDQLSVRLPPPPAGVLNMPAGSHLQWRVRVVSAGRVAESGGFKQLRQRLLHYSPGFGPGKLWPRPSVAGRAEHVDHLASGWWDENRERL